MKPGARNLITDVARAAGRQRVRSGSQIRDDGSDGRRALRRVGLGAGRRARHAGDRPSRPRQVGARGRCAGPVGRQRLRARCRRGGDGGAARGRAGLFGVLGPGADRSGGDPLRPPERRGEGLGREPLPRPRSRGLRRGGDGVRHRHRRRRNGCADRAVQGRARLGVGGSGQRRDGGRARGGEPDGLRGDAIGQAFLGRAFRDGRRVRRPRPRSGARLPAAAAEPEGRGHVPAGQHHDRDRRDRHRPRQGAGTSHGGRRP